MQSPIEKIINLQNFNNIVTQNKYSVISFSTTWCGPCKIFSPIFEKEASTALADIGFYKIELDTCDVELGESIDVAAVPTFRLYYAGQVKKEFSGASQEKLKDLISYAS